MKILFLFVTDNKNYIKINYFKNFTFGNSPYTAKPVPWPARAEIIPVPGIPTELPTNAVPARPKSVPARRNIVLARPV